MFNIFFSGFAGSGKTFLCEYLKKKYGFVQAKMAYPVYQICENYLDMKQKDRKLLQYLGTEIARKHIDTGIWVHRFLEDTWIAQKTAKDLYNRDLCFVSDDVRFKNEFDALKEQGWVGIWVDAPQEIRLQRLTGRDGDPQANTLNHLSETAMNEFKDELLQLDSSGTLDQTYQKLEELLEYIRREILTKND